MSQKIALSRVNEMTIVAFIECLGSIAEHSPWVAEAAVRHRPFADVKAMIEAFATAVRAATPERQLELIRAHPDLAGKAKITAESRREQKRAGLDALSAEEFARFTALNEAYRRKFGFPFIFAVRDAAKQQILEAFEQRIGNAADAEFDTALAQVCAILRFRLEDRVSS